MSNVLLGGAITLVVTLLVQIFVVPWVTRRNRRLDEWENDVLRLGGLLAQQIAIAQREVSQRLQSLKDFRFSDPNWSPVDGAFQYSDQSLLGALMDAVDEYEQRVVTEAYWLCRRVASRGTEGASVLREAVDDVIATFPHRLHYRDAPDSDDPAAVESELTLLQGEVDRFSREWEMNRQAVFRLREEVNQLADQISAPTRLGW